jgi:hypothetical protein
MGRHPFLICEREQFPDLRGRAEREPWKTMARKAADRVAAGMEGTGASGSPVELHRYLGAAAVRYIVAPDDRAARAADVRDGILDGLEAVEFDPDAAWKGTVPPMGAAFVAILALDIVHDDLSDDAVGRCEAVIERKIATIDRDGAWPAARLGTHGTWEIYTGERDGPDDAFYENYRGQMTEDGVTTVATSYAFARLGSDDSRPQKTGYADVLEFTGVDQRYYDDPVFRNFYRWLFSASVDPAKRLHMFGDVIVTASHRNDALQWRVGRFDERAAAHAAWYLEDETPPGHVLSYVLLDDPLPEPVVPGSQLFDDGGAAFRPSDDRPKALGSALYNITENDEWHTHEETNAIACSAYGTRLLVNGGWLGPPTRPPERNNTIAIDGERHERKTGAGLVEGLLCDGFDYACGDSGDALGDATFRRSLVQVHGRGSHAGYFVTFDEVDARSDATVHHYLHPAAESEPTEVDRGHEYRASIDHHTEVEGVELVVDYPAGPESVAREPVSSGKLDHSTDAGEHYRMEAHYRTDGEGRRRVPTVLVPTDPDHPAADVTPIQHRNASGATVAHGDGVTDLLLASRGDVSVEAEGVSAAAEAVVCRQGTTDGFYFARRGQRLTAGREGFEASQPTSIFKRGTAGRFVTAERGTLSIRCPAPTGVRLDGRDVDALETADDRIRFEAPPGRHAFEIETDASPAE